MSDLMLTVVIEDIGDAANVGGPVTRRTVRVPLTDDQDRRLELRHTWERIGLTIIEDWSDDE